MSISELQQITIAVLVVGLGLICFLVIKIIKILQKHLGQAALRGFLILAAFAIFEIFRLLIARQSWYNLPWYANPFLYFWLILLGFGLIQYFKKSKES